MRTRLLPLLLCLLLLTGCSGLPVSPPPEDYEGQADGFRYARACLTGQERYLYDQLLEGLMAQSPRIEDLYPDNDMLNRAVQAIDKDYPELFWFAGSGEIETSLLGSKALSAAYIPHYNMDETQRAEMQALVDSWTAQCMAELPEGADSYHKALFVYEYIINHADYQVVENNSILNIMVHGAGLCGCYAKTAQYLLNRMGVDCAYISGEAKGEKHAWNLMWLDGVPCWMDPTWGDPVFDGGDPNMGPVYDYFGLTTADLLRTHTPDNNLPLPDCTAEELNYYRHEGLYFTSYDQNAILSAMETAVSQGKAKVSLRFADNIWAASSYSLLNTGDVYTFFCMAENHLNAGLNPNQSIWYSRNDDMCTVAIKIPY